MKLKITNRIGVLVCASALLLASLSAACRRGGSTTFNANSSASNNAGDNATQNIAVTNEDIAKMSADIDNLKKELERNAGDETIEEDLSNAYTRRGNAYRATNRLKEALVDYRAAVDANPDNEDARQRGEAVASELGVVFSPEDSTEKDLVQAKGGGSEDKPSEPRDKKKEDKDKKH